MNDCESGFTLVEVLVALAVLSMVGMAGTALVGNSLVAERRLGELHLAEDFLSRLEYERAPELPVYGWTLDKGEEKMAFGLTVRHYQIKNDAGQILASGNFIQIDDEN